MRGNNPPALFKTILRMTACDRLGYRYLVGCSSLHLLVATDA